MNLYAVDYVIVGDSQTIVNVYVLADSYVDALIKLDKQTKEEFLRVTMRRLGNKVII